MSEKQRAAENSDMADEKQMQETALLSGADKYGIYQLRDDPELSRLRFKGTWSLKQAGILKENAEAVAVKPENYDLVYVGDLSELKAKTAGLYTQEDTLHALFEKSISRGITQDIPSPRAISWCCGKMGKTPRIMSIQRVIPKCPILSVCWRTGGKKSRKRTVPGQRAEWQGKSPLRKNLPGTRIYRRMWGRITRRENSRKKCHCKGTCGHCDHKL